MKIAVCVIAKWESQYILEWVEHYKGLGFDNILFYDNNELDDDSQYLILKPYIKDGFIIYHNRRGLSGNTIQKQAYRDCMIKYRDIYDWIAFYDADEFLVIDDNFTIKEFLDDAKFQDYTGVCLNLVEYGDNDMVYNDKRPLKERFTQPIKKTRSMVKTIIQTKNCKIVNNWKSVHYPFIDNKINNICNANGDSITNIQTCAQAFITPSIYLNHYIFKTIEECVTKIKKGDINNRTYDNSSIKERIDDYCRRFFSLNKITIEKLKYICDSFPELQ